MPIDGIIVDGEANIDVQSLTGESLPKHLQANDEILSGSIVLDSVLIIQTTSVYENSTVYKILDMIENASDKKSKTETVISKMTKWYTLGVILLALLVWGIVWAITKDINTAISRFNFLGRFLPLCICNFSSINIFFWHRQCIKERHFD